MSSVRRPRREIQPSGQPSTTCLDRTNFGEKTFLPGHLSARAFRPSRAGSRQPFVDARYRCVLCSIHVYAGYIKNNLRSRPHHIVRFPTEHSPVIFRALYYDRTLGVAHETRQMINLRLARESGSIVTRVNKTSRDRGHSQPFIPCHALPPGAHLGASLNIQVLRHGPRPVIDFREGLPPPASSHKHLPTIK